MIYNEIASVSYKENWLVKYEVLFGENNSLNSSLKMVGINNPLSIKENEFNFIRNFVFNNKLYRGYEIATGVGISCIAAGLGMKDNLFKLAPKIITMDAYIEENRDHSMSYIGEDKVTYQDASGWKSVNQLIKHFGLEGIVIPKIGWSPDDTKKTLSEEFDLAKEKLDFVFIDGLHTDDAVIADIESIKEYLAEKYVVFLHDTHAFSDKVYKYVDQVFGRPWIVAPGCAPHEFGFNLSYITNI